jgi:hypothetical protein
MRLLLGLAVAAAAYLYLRRTRPATAQKLEGRATALVGDLTGRSQTRAEGQYDEFVGGARERFEQAG